MSARDKGPDYYTDHKVQVWDIVDEYKLDHYRACALKYLLRTKGDPLGDLKKAIHCIEKAIERLGGTEEMVAKGRGRYTEVHPGMWVDTAELTSSKPGHAIRTYSECPLSEEENS